MESNKEDAAEAKKIAEEKMRAGDFVGALKFVTKAQILSSNLENTLQMKTICDVHISATEKIKGLDNWYGILQVQPFADTDAIKKQYRKLALILHPDKNKYVGSEAAFKLVGEANKWLSDQIKRSQYDVRYRCYLKLANKYANANSGRNWARENNATENAAEVRKPQTAMTKSDEIPKTDVSNAQHQVKEPHPSATKTLSSAPKKDQTAKETRIAVEESSKSSEVHGSDVAGVKTDTNENMKRKSSRIKPQMSYAEGGSNDDFVIRPNKKTKSGREFESNFNTKHMAADSKSRKLPDSGVSSATSHASTGKAKKNVNSGNEDILLAKNKESEACDGNREDVALPSKIDRVEVGYRSNENPRKLDILDQEFNVFEVERKTENFAANQVWSTIDSRDGMPRKYALVKKVLKADFKLQITYLEPVQDKNHTSIPVACGKFKNGKTEEVEDCSIFSGLMHHCSCNRIVSIYPRKGEIWAIFRDWNENWNTGLEKHQLPYKYDFVQIVSNFHDVNGLGLAYLGKIKGSVSLFHREVRNGVCLFQNPPDEMLRFSHKVPAVKMIGKEKECVRADSYKLDPAALPKDICQVDEVDMETDSKILKGKADGLCPEAPKVKVEANSDTEAAPSPRKHRKSDDDNGDGLCPEAPKVKVEANSDTEAAPSLRKRRQSDDDNGVCSNREEVKGNTRKSHGCLSSQVDEPRLRQKVEDRKNELALLKNQIESQRKLLERQSLELVSKEMELGCVKASLKQCNSDLKLKEKLVQSLNDRETDCNKMIDSRSEQLRKIQKLIELQTNALAVLYNQGDSIKQLIQELSEKLIAKEMELERVGKSSKYLELDLKVKEKRVQALNNQITISSEQLELKSKELGEIQRELELKSKELGEIQRELELKSKELGEIQRELELKKQLRQMSNVLVECEKQPAAASTIDTRRQNAAETVPIFDSAIRKFVKELIKKSQYIQAVRLICIFKLNEDEEFSPSHLITKEINNLRCSDLEMGQTESSQAKDKDAGKLRAILQLVADYNLDINLPGYLIAKLMI